MTPRFKVRIRDFSDENQSSEEEPTSQEELSDELLGLKSHKHPESDYTTYPTPEILAMDAEKEIIQPLKVQIRSPKVKILSVEDIKSKHKFNWLAFWTMLVSIAVVVFLVIFVPGPFDEIAAAIALSAINAFIANYRK